MRVVKILFIILRFKLCHLIEIGYLIRQTVYAVNAPQYLVLFDMSAVRSFTNRMKKSKSINYLLSARCPS